MNRRILLLAALLGASLPGAARSDEPITLRYGQNAAGATGLSSLPLTVAQRKNFFAREGINLVVVPIQGGTDRIVAALDKGEIDAGKNATPYLIQAVLKGSNSVGIIGGSANQVYSLIAKPEIKSFDDLKGKMVGMSLAVDTISIASRMLLEKHGLTEGAYRSRELVGTPVRADCLNKGECDAVPLGQPDDIMFVRRGYNKLGDSLEVIPVLQFGVIAARRDWAQANRDAVVRLTRAIGAAYSFMRDQANRAEVTALAADMTGAPAEVMRAVLAFYYEPDRGMMPRQGEIDMAGVAKVIELLGRSGELKAPLPAAERFVDLQYLKAAGLQ
jgi:ABC-type nitrate/sulfonate/bicarbonate transport system substrate-binding protein